MNEGLNFFKTITNIENLEATKRTFFTPTEEEIKKLKIEKFKLDNFHIQRPKITYKAQGDLLEKYILMVFQSNKIFNCKINTRGSSNEIDIIVTMTSLGETLKTCNLIPNWVNETILIECKNYTKNTPVTYLNKFHSILETNNIKLGIFSSYLGLSGKDKVGWIDAKGFVKKISLINQHSKDKPLILDIDQSHYNLLIDFQYNIIEWLKEIYNAMILDINLCKISEEDQYLYEIIEEEKKLEFKTISENNSLKSLDPIVYVVKGRYIYHRENCRHNKNTRPMSLEEARDLGLRACKSCKL